MICFSSIFALQKVEERCMTIKSYGTHMDFTSVSCGSVHLWCLFGPVKKLVPKTHILIEMNGKCIQGTHGCIFGPFFSQIFLQVQQDVMQPQNILETRQNHGKNAYVFLSHFCNRTV